MLGSNTAPPAGDAPGTTSPATHPGRPFDMAAWRKEWGAFWGPKLREISAQAIGRT